MLSKSQGTKLLGQEYVLLSAAHEHTACIGQHTAHMQMHVHVCTHTHTHTHIHTHTHSHTHTCTTAGTSDTGGMTLGLPVFDGKNGITYLTFNL